MQQDAIDRLGLHRLLLEPELLADGQPDVTSSATLMALRDALPEGSRETARAVVRQVVAEIEGRLDATAPAAPPAGRWTAARGPRGPGPPTSTGTARSRANLQHYQPEHADGHPRAARRPRAAAALARSAS